MDKNEWRLAQLVTAEVRLAHAMEALDSAIAGCERLQYDTEGVMMDEDLGELRMMRIRTEVIRNKITAEIDR